MAREISPDNRREVTPVSREATPVRVSGKTSATGSRAPVHDGSGLHLVDGQPGREECWATLGPKLVARLNELSGDAIAWYAAQDPAAGDGRAEAGVLGVNGFTVGLPRWNDQRQPVYSIASFQFDASSHRTVPVQGYGSVSARRSVPSRPGPGGAGGTGSEVRGLTESTRGELGNLPPQAQELLQAPFMSGDEILRSECWYEGYADRLETYIMVLAGRHTVTAAVGGNYVPAGGRADAPNWTLMCHRFAVVRRIGQ